MTKKCISEMEEYVLKYIRSYRAIRGFSPSMREIGEYCNTTPSMAAYYVDNLERFGHVKHIRNVARAIIPLLE